MPTQGGLVERALAFSGSYVSDDGRVRISRAHAGAFEYSGDRFVGSCDVCARAGLIPARGELLADVAAAGRFLATHDHGDVD
ncbi:MAG TPA: hypothetical protein VK402_21545 [Blastococcus sp.]|nr:hypothetical protein [Blastococcus sp.]